MMMIPPTTNLLFRMSPTRLLRPSRIITTNYTCRSVSLCHSYYSVPIYADLVLHHHHHHHHRGPSNQLSNTPNNIHSYYNLILRLSSSTFSSPSVVNLANERIRAVMEGQPWKMTQSSSSSSSSCNKQKCNTTIILKHGRHRDQKGPQKPATSSSYHPPPSLSTFPELPTTVPTTIPKQQSSNMMTMESIQRPMNVRTIHELHNVRAECAIGLWNNTTTKGEEEDDDQQKRWTTIPLRRRRRWYQDDEIISSDTMNRIIVNPSSSPSYSPTLSYSHSNNNNNNSYNDSLIHPPITPLCPTKTYLLRLKGTTTQNSGGAGVGFVLYDCNNNNNNNNNNPSSSSCTPNEPSDEIWSGRIYVSGDRTAFEAEYTAIILGLDYAYNVLGIRTLIIQTCNEAMVHQITGQYKTTKSSLKVLLDIEKKLEMKFNNCTGDGRRGNDDDNNNNNNNILIQTITTEENSKAKALAHLALATRKSLNIVDQPSDDHDDNDGEASNKDSTNRIGSTTPSSCLWHVRQRDPIRELARNPQKVGRWKEADDPSKSAKIDPTKVYLLRFDGGSRGNPGIAGAGMVIYDDDGQEIWCGWHYIPRPATNNVAEYVSMVCGLKCVRSLGIRRIIVEGDSQLIVRQMNGTYRTRETTLRVFHEKAIQLAQELDYVEIRHIPRAENKRADWLANHAMDLKESHGFELFGEEDQEDGTNQ